MPSEIIAEPAVNPAVVNLLTAVAKLAPMAAYIALVDSAAIHH
jgi:hypothetical protein